MQYVPETTPKLCCRCLKRPATHYVLRRSRYGVSKYPRCDVCRDKKNKGEVNK